MLRRLCSLALASCCLTDTSGHGADYRPPRKDLGFAIYTNAPSGRQLSGQHAPASTPALSPEDAQRKFTVPDGFEVRLFASEPEIVNPVAMTWDERGRLWVVELYEYPLGAKPGEKPRDRIKILEDTDADGRADKVHVWADGLNLATAILLGHGGAFVGQAPHLLFLRDTDGDDRADTTEVVKTGFGLEDRHELLNGFTWGPDGQMYMTHGVFTRSKVVAPNDPADDPVLLTAGVARFNLQTKKFEIYAEGTSNPWGVDFDRTGNAYVSACVIEHLFHLVPGGIYDRQAGTPPHPYAYESLHAINDHKHHMAAYAGIQVYQGNQFPADNTGTILQGNIHDNAVHQDVLKPNGSSFIASHWRDLVRANDGWFMPVSTQVGPDGAVWIMDWYDRYPCYQNANADPAGVDREHGRIWRVVHTGSEKGKPVPSRPARDMNLAKLSSAELTTFLAHPNAWHRRMAQRLLNERRDDKVMGILQNLFATGRTAAATSPPSLDTRLAAFWTLHSSGYLADDQLTRAARDPEPAIRTWAARFIGERQVGNDSEISLLTQLAQDPDASVRLAVAVASRQFTSSHLTVNRPPAREDVPIGRALVALLQSSAQANDPVIPFMLWHAAEPLAARRPANVLTLLADEGHRFLPLAGQIASKMMRRLCDLGDAASMDLAVTFIDRALPNSVLLTEAALDGLIAGQAGKALTPSQGVGPFIAKLSAHSSSSIASRGQKLGALWGDAAALRAILQVAANPAANPEDRVRAIQTARTTKNAVVREAMLGVVGTTNPEPVQIAAIDALGELGGNEIAEDLIGRWKTLSAGARSAAANAMASRRRWAMPLLAEVKAGRISASDFGPAVIRNLVNNRDEAVREEAKNAIGRFRESGADKAALVAAKRRIALEGEPNLDAGREVAQRVCLVCHKLHGEGQIVGPDLTGVGRSSLDSLLWNILDPNQVIGAGYEQVEVETKDDRVVAGRLIEDTDARVRLLLIGGKEEVIGKSDIRSRRTLDGSVMPEGLGEMPDADLRNMLWYILAPPQEGPLNREKRERLSGGGHASNPTAAAADQESIALWNPEWRIAAPIFEGTPAKLPEYQGRANVLQTHPFNGNTAAALERTLDLPAGRSYVLRMQVAAHDQGDWKLRVLADGQPIHETIIDHGAPRWRTVSVDLKPFAGRKVKLRLENAANDWSYEFGYWANLKVDEGG
jgi:putative membrane-bound dehydrogenase-like protein